MSSATGLNFPSCVDDTTDIDVSSSYTIATEYLKDNYSYIFMDGKEGVIVTCLIGKWSHNFLPSEVKKNGTIEDKAKKPKKVKKKRGSVKKCKKRATEK